MKRITAILLFVLMLTACVPANNGGIVTTDETPVITAPVTEAVTTETPETTAEPEPAVKYTYKYIIEPKYDYYNVEPLFVEEFSGKSIGYPSKENEERGVLFKYAYYFDGAERGILKEDGTVGLDASLDIRWCNLEGIVDKVHSSYDKNLNFVGPSGHGYTTAFYDSSTGKIFYDGDGFGYVEEPVSASMKVAELINNGGIKETGKYIVLYEGKPVTSDDLDRAYNSYDAEGGIVSVCKDDKWYYIDAATGAKLFDADYEYAYPFYDGIAAVKKDGKWGYIDASGVTVIPFEFDATRPQYKGIAWVKSNGLWGKIEITAQ